MNFTNETKTWLERSIKENKELETEIRQNAIKYAAQNISEIRKLIAHTSLLSSAVIGILVSIGQRGDFVKNKSFVIYAVVMLIFVIGVALIYLKEILEKENKSLPETNKCFLELLSNNIQLGEKLLANPSQESLKAYVENGTKEREKYKQIIEIRSSEKRNDYILAVLIFTFIGALLLVLLSLIDFH